MVRLYRRPGVIKCPSRLPLRLIPILLFFAIALPSDLAAEESKTIRALLITGQMNKHHNHPDLMDQAVVSYLEGAGLFEVTVA